MGPIITGVPLLQQLQSHGFSFDQVLNRALQVSASKPNLHPEDIGFPDSYLTVALYRLNTILTRTVSLNQTRWNLFHDYHKAEKCLPKEVMPGNRLCGVINKAIKLAEPSKVIGHGHFLRAIIDISLHDHAYPAHGFNNMVLHNTFSIESLLWGLGYNAWTPLSKAVEVAHLLKVLKNRDDTENIQYLMTLEGSHLAFRPLSTLGSVVTLDNNAIVVPGLAVLTHLKDCYAGVTADEIAELEGLINSPRALEIDFQRFFEDHSQFFSMWHFTKSYSHIYLTRESEGPLIPDFLLVNHSLSEARLIDLKLPSAKTVVHKTNRDRFASAVAEARAQLLEYRDWFEKDENRRRLKETVGLEIFRPRMGIIIGTNRDFRNEVEKQILRSHNDDVDVVTYDDILANARRRLILVKEGIR